MTRGTLLLAIAFALGGCGGSSNAAPAVSATPAGSKIEVTKAEVDREQYEFLGDVQGSSKGFNLAAAQAGARNDLKNNAANMGADLVVLDTNTAGNAMDWSGRNQVVLAGRAFHRRASVGALPPADEPEQEVTPDAQEAAPNKFSSERDDSIAPPKSPTAASGRGRPRRPPNQQ